MQLQTEQLKKQAEKAFPITELVEESSVIHARNAWVNAVQYLRRNQIEIKPLICPRVS